MAARWLSGQKHSTLRIDLIFFGYELLMPCPTINTAYECRLVHVHSFVDWAAASVGIMGPRGTRTRVGRYGHETSRDRPFFSSNVLPG